ncbi:hypothetical protein AD953_04875 [Acetobacter malorum]|uniref:Uncharacterized protein n=1 Tax=Acetobacter malorum TaxID=178901 RepID=A0A149V9Y2_9PROT|nr:hypothetical protein AD953_04875 [Acetobacter malorum]
MRGALRRCPFQTDDGAPQPDKSGADQSVTAKVGPFFPQLTDRTGERAIMITFNDTRQPQAKGNAV